MHLLALLAVLDAAAPRLQAVFTAVPPAFDGTMDDPLWQRAPAAAAFTQKAPNEGAVPTEHTVLRVLYDADALYVGFDCEQLHAPVSQRLSRRGTILESDWVSIDVGSRRDGKSAFEFAVNASGVLADGLRFNDTDFSTDWHENWEAKTRVRPGGWTAVFRIPFRVLRFELLPEQAWGFEARRYISADQETDEWAFIPRTAGGEVSHYGKLVGLRNLQRGPQIELLPFALARARRRDPVPDQVASGTDFGASAGLDLRWHPTQLTTVDATFNPDFAQVEADNLVLNLTNFETFYPEQRPFFNEGIDVFATPMQLLYTRRIGRVPDSPTLRDSPPFSETLVDAASATTIYGAAKLTSLLGDRWRIGALEAVTAPNDVQVQLADGARQKRTVDPLTSFSVLRLKGDVGANADIGIIGTAVVRAEHPSKYPLTGSSQLCPTGTVGPPDTRCFNDAYVGGLDGRWRSPDGDWVTAGQVAFSLLDKGPPRLVRDGTVVRPGTPGVGSTATLAKEGGEHWVGDAGIEVDNRYFDPNDLGFFRRANIISWYSDLEYRDLQPGSLFLETHARFEYFDAVNLNGLDLGSGYQLNVSGKLKNFWRFFTEIHWRPKKFDDREAGDGAALQRAGLLGHELSLSSDPTQRVSFSLSTQTQFLSDGFNFSGNAGVLLRALPNVDLQFLPTLRYTFGEPRFIATGAPGQYFFGKLRAKAAGVTSRATYTFTPRLSLQMYAQLFLASEHRTDFSSYQSDPSAPRPVIRISDLTPYQGPLPENPDFEEGVLNVNVILRWEYRLGSTLFLVYSRSQLPEVSLGANEPGALTFAAVRRSPAADTVLVKLSYWY